MNKKVPLIKKEITNDKMPLDWQYGLGNTNIILKNDELNVKLLRYVITLPNGKVLFDTFSIKESRNNTVAIVRNEHNELGLLWEWRPIPEKWFWACPRGFGDPNDEDNIATGRREMIEEIGHCVVKESKKIGNLYQNTTFYENPVGLVLLDVEEVETKVSHEEGIADFKFYPKVELLKMIREDKVEDTFTLSAIMRFFALEGF